MTHDYLVHSLRDWLTRKQKETRRGRAELRLVDRSSLWNAKPENRHLPSLLEWTNIGLLTKKKDWTEPQRKMMRRAGRVHGVRGVLTFALLSAGVLAGIAVRRQVIENQRATHAADLVQRVLDADTAQVPEIVKAMSDHRQWVDSSLRSELEKSSDGSRQKLHASLALLPVDASQVDYLFNRLIKATPSGLPVLRDALKTHRTSLTPKLWTVLESAKLGDANLLPSASALANYDPDNAKWEAAGGKVAQGLVSVNAVFLGPWIEALRPVRGKLAAPLATIFRDRNRSESEREQATDILTDYATDDPDRLAELLMVSDPKAYLSFFPIAERQAVKTLPLFQAELAKKATYSWNDPPLDPTWAKPDVSLVSRIESAQGILAERFAFCQTMPLDELVTTAEALRKSGYRPVRFRPYADGQAVRVAAVWTRDGRNWRISSGLTAEEVRTQDERNREGKFLLVDVAGYVAVTSDGKPDNRYAAIWVEKAVTEDEARMYVGATPDDHRAVMDGLKAKNLISRTMQAMRGSDGRFRYCGVWGRSPVANPAWQFYWGQSEAGFEQRNQATHSDKILADVSVSGSEPPRSTRERARVSLEVAEAALKAKPDDLNARLARASAYFQLGENPKAIDDLNAVIKKAPQTTVAYQSRALAHAHLGHKDEALADLAQFQKGKSTESTRLYLAVVVATELGEGTDQAFEKLDAALQKQPQDAGLHYVAACAYALASQPLAKKDPAKGRDCAERAIHLLQTAIQNGYSDYNHMQEDADLDPIRDLPAFIEIMKAGHPDRSYCRRLDGRFPVRGELPLRSRYRCSAPAVPGTCGTGLSQVALSVARTSPGDSRSPPRSGTAR